MFEVKDSGKRAHYSSGMVRDTNESKDRYDLIIPLYSKDNMFTRWARHMEKGALKYGDRNWEKANTEEELHRFKQSAFRHFMQWYLDEEDEDHASATFFNIQGAEYTKIRINEKKGSSEEIS